MLRYEDFQYTFRNVGSEFKSCVRLEISWQEKADMTEKFKSKYNSATAEKALPVGKQPAQQQPDAACQPGNEWVFRYELRYPSSCGLLCWISSVVFVRCTPLALSAGKKRKIEKKNLFFFLCPNACVALFFLHTFSPRKTGKVEKKNLSLPERMCCTFFFCIPFPREKREKSKKILFFFLCPNARVFFFVSAYLFPAKNGKNRKKIFFSSFARPAASLAGWLAGCAFNWLRFWPACRLAGCLASWLAGTLTRLVGLATWFRILVKVSAK